MAKKPLTKRGTPKAKANVAKRTAASKARTKKKPNTKEVMSSTTAQKIGRVAKNVNVGKLLKQTFSGFVDNNVKSHVKDNMTIAKNKAAKRKQTSANLAASKKRTAKKKK